ncbi:MAG: hypothetical protein Q7R83_02650 [bacterium]|nr:hypothetical protein [bacterium]
MAKKDVSSIERGAGYFLGFITALMNVVRQKSIPFEAIYRLGTEGGYGTVGKIVDLAYADWQAEQPKPIVMKPSSVELPKDHYRVSLKYAGMPPMDALKKEWGKDNVSVIFDGRPFSLHTSCVGMDRTPGEKVFCLYDTGIDGWESEAEIGKALERRDQFAPKGRRPATEEETYEFAMAHPELVDFGGFGSFAVLDGLRYVARVWRDGGQRILGIGWVDSRFLRWFRFLLVSK